MSPDELLTAVNAGANAFVRDDSGGDYVDIDPARFKLGRNMRWPVENPP